MVTPLDDVDILFAELDHIIAVAEGRTTVPLDSSSTPALRAVQKVVQCKDAALEERNFNATQIDRYLDALEKCAHDEWNRGVYGPARQILKQ